MKRPLLAVIQARLASTRLPGKALLTVGGLPAVALCARRAANTGLPVIVATSSDTADDAIVEALERYDVSYFRGSQCDVMARFLGATAALPDDGIVVRLTADNLFPDGTFVEEIVEAFLRRDVEYLGTDSPRDGLPYGLSAEVFTVGVLRLAGRSADSPVDREHVTPWIRRHARAARHTVADPEPNWSNLRCTLDTFEDYETLLQVFRGVETPALSPWRQLVERLAVCTPHGVGPRCPFVTDDAGRVQSVLTLGTAQIGLSYGIANRRGLPKDQDVAKILKCAVDSGITSLDTARAYGASEERIGRLLPSGHRGRIETITKLDVLGHLAADADRKTVQGAVEASVYRSAHALHSRRLDVLLLHRWSHRRAWNGAVWDVLVDLKRQGIIGRLGASVSTPAEAIDALGDADVEHLQCPVNILDWRWKAAEFLGAVGARRDVVVHARSILLQGLLSLPAAEWVSIPGVDASQVCTTLDRWATTMGRLDRVDLCIAYVRGLPWVDSLVMGVDTLEQLQKNLTRAHRPALSHKEIVCIDESLPHLPETLLNPAHWDKSSA